MKIKLLLIGLLFFIPNLFGLGFPPVTALIPLYYNEHEGEWYALLAEIDDNEKSLIIIDRRTTNAKDNRAIFKEIFPIYKNLNLDDENRYYFATPRTPLYMFFVIVPYKNPHDFTVKPHITLYGDTASSEIEKVINYVWVKMSDIANDSIDVYNDEFTFYNGYLKRKWITLYYPALEEKRKNLSQEFIPDIDEDIMRKTEEFLELQRQKEAKELRHIQSQQKKKLKPKQEAQQESKRFKKEKLRKKLHELRNKLKELLRRIL